MQNGFLAGGSDAGPLANIKLTGKGSQRNREMERRSARRVMAFERLYKTFEKQIDKGKAEAQEDETGPGKTAT